jgi:hypothetical protein
MGWTREIHEQFIKNGQTLVEFGANTHTDMREQLRPFRGIALNANYGGQRLNFSSWPFVEIIGYCLENAILEQGLCIADVPGSNDLNLYRVRIALEYLQTCEITLVVGDIKRVLSDANFQQHFLQAHSRRYHGSVILCATRSDEMNDDRGCSLQLDTEADVQLAPISTELDEKISIEEQLERNKAAVKRAQRKDECGTSTEKEVEPNTVARTPEELKEDSKVLIARKK